MRFVLPFVAAVLPVIIAPGLLFHFDVIPKLAFLLIGTSVALVFWRGELPLGCRRNRWFLILLAAAAISTTLATAFSTHPALSLNGGEWRRFGMTAQLAIFLFAALVATDCAADSSRRRSYLQAIVLGGTPVALYGIAQYFGWDPWLPRQAYHVGEGASAIVRTPSTLGHADYLASYLLFVVFSSVALVRTRTWRVAAVCAALISVIAIVLSGTRAALIGLLVGAIVNAALERGAVRSLNRSAWIVTATAVMVLLAGAVAFYFSPAGRALRARVSWASTEPVGGARPLLWRDSLRMATHHVGLGFGPETFLTEFPRSESIELARQYPDFMHESPHNIFLDALVSEGLPGLGALVALCIWGFFAAIEAPALAGALAAAVVAQIFTAFTLPTAFFFFLILGLLARPGGLARIPLLRVASVTCAALLTVFAVRYLVADRALAVMTATLDPVHIESAIRAYDRAVRWQPPGASSDIYCSRRFAEVYSKSTLYPIKARALQAAIAAAARAPRSSDNAPAAWYNLAVLLALSSSPEGVERSLREAITSAPNWYKPHWILAQLLTAEQHWEQAHIEARRAISCNPRAPELLRTLENIDAAERHLKR